MYHAAATVLAFAVVKGSTRSRDSVAVPVGRVTRRPGCRKPRSSAFSPQDDCPTRRRCPPRRGCRFCQSDWHPGLPSWAAGTSYSPSWRRGPRLNGDDSARGSWPCTAWEVRARPGGGGVRAPAPGRGWGGVAVPCRGPDGAGGRVWRAGRPAGGGRGSQGRRPGGVRAQGAGRLRPRGCWYSTMPPTRRRSTNSCPRPGMAGC